MATGDKFEPVPVRVAKFCAEMLYVLEQPASLFSPYSNFTL